MPNEARLLALPLFPAQEVSSQGSRHCPFFPHRGHVPRCVGGLLGGGWTPYQRWTAAALRWAQHWRLVGRFDSQEGELYRRGHSDGSSFVSRECLAPDPTRCDTVLGERGLCNPYLLLSNRWRFSRAQTCLITRPAGDRWSCSDKKRRGHHKCVTTNAAHSARDVVSIFVMITPPSVISTSELLALAEEDGTAGAQLMFVGMSHQNDVRNAQALPAHLCAR